MTNSVSQGPEFPLLAANPGQNDIRATRALTLPMTGERMSLVIAVKATDGAVLAADTRVNSINDGMNYAVHGVKKIVQFGRNAAVGITGNVRLMQDFLDEAEQKKTFFVGEVSLSKRITEIAAHLREFCKDRCGISSLQDMPLKGTSLTFVGQMPDDQGFILGIDPKGNVGSRDRFHVCGQDSHGGCYYLCRFYRSEMDTKEASYLAYFCICEVASLDGTVGLPTEIWRSHKGTMEPVAESWMQEFRRRHHEAHEQMHRWFGIKQG